MVLGELINEHACASRIVAIELTFIIIIILLCSE